MRIISSILYQINHRKEYEQLSRICIEPILDNIQIQYNKTKRIDVIHDKPIDWPSIFVWRKPWRFWAKVFAVLWMILVFDDVWIGIMHIFLTWYEIVSDLNTLRFKWCRSKSLSSFECKTSHLWSRNNHTSSMWTINPPMTTEASKWPYLHLYSHNNLWSWNYWSK